MASQERFGYEWDKYDELLPEYEEQFLMWMGPLKKESFSGKDILDAGCGMGRNSYWPCTYGARRVVAFDYDERSVSAARRTLKKFPQATVRYESIYDIAYENEFDIAFSIGVIHHLQDPKKALSNLFRAVRKGGAVIIWVYGRENNEIKVKLVNFLRFFTSRLPVGLVHYLAYVFSIPLYLFIKIFPHNNDYMNLLKKFRFYHIHSIVFDQLIPRIANYWRKDEVESLINSLPANKICSIYHIRNYSWTAVIEKK